MSSSTPECINAKRQLDREELRKRAADYAGKKMDYLVCMDTADAVVFRDWMASADMKAIPTTIIIDQEGKVSWIGHPETLPGQPNPVDKVIDELLAGKFDYNKAAANFVSDTARNKVSAKTRTIVQPLLQALAAKEYDAVLAKAAEYCAANPGREKDVLVPRVLALAHRDEAKALELAKTATSMDLLQVAAGLVADDRLSKPMYEFAATCSNRK